MYASELITSHGLELAVAALAIAWLLPRLVSGVKIARWAVKIGGPAGEQARQDLCTDLTGQVLIRLRNDPKISSIRYVPMCGSPSHLVVDSTIIQRSLSSPLLDNHAAFHRVDVPIFGASSDWLNQRPAYESAFDALIERLRQGGSNAMGTAYSTAAEIEFDELAKRVNAVAGGMEVSYADSIGNAFARATSLSFMGQHDVDYALDLYFRFDRASHLFMPCEMLRPWVPLAISRKLICDDGHRARTELQNYWIGWLRSEQFAEAPRVIRECMLAARENGFNDQDMGALCAS